MNVKRIITSLGMLAFTGAVVVGGTGAFFTDTETSTGNVFTAGSVSIEFDGIEHTYGYGNGEDPVDGYFTTGMANTIPFFTFTDLKPRDAGTLEFDFDNGANEAYVCGFIGGEEPEANPDLALWQNLNFYEAVSGDQVLPGTWFDLGTIDPDTTDTFGVDYCFGDWDGTSCDVDPNVDYNEAQNGTFGADLTLFAIQTRNNDGFSCDQLTFDNEGNPVYTPAPQVLVGANFDLYEAPQNCTVTLTDGASINSAITSATAGDVICLDDGTYSGPVELNKGVTLASVSGPAATTIDGGVKITSSDVVVKGFTVLAGVVPAEPNPVGFYVASGNDIEISSNDVDGTGTSNGSGVLTVTGATYNNVLVENNVFSNLTRGMYTNPASGLIDVHYNDFLASNAVGIAGFNGAYAWRNEFSAAEALGVDGSYDANPSDVEENNFLAGADINVYVALTTNVNAPNNFFNLGAVNQVNNQLSGEVDFTPEAGAQYAHR
jgi:predicted ribosomally synthesized peptide with SipW-like signal peptide